MKYVKKNTGWTVDEMEKVVRLWDSKSYDDLCKELGRKRESIQYMVHQMRKSGIRMSKKGRKGTFQEHVKELKERLKIK